MIVTALKFLDLSLIAVAVWLIFPPVDALVLPVLPIVIVAPLEHSTTAANSLFSLRGFFPKLPKITLIQVSSNALIPRFKLDSVQILLPKLSVARYLVEKLRSAVLEGLARKKTLTPTFYKLN